MDAGAFPRDISSRRLYQPIEPFNFVADSTQPMRAYLNDLGILGVHPGSLQIVDNHVSHVRILKAANQTLAQRKCCDT